MLCGCQGVNGGGWAHYVGQEKVRPITGFSQVAFALDWNRPPRHQAATPFWYLATEQWRYEAFAADELASPLGEGMLEGAHFADLYAKAARMGWLPAYPSFDRNPLDITAAAEAEGIAPGRLRGARAEGGHACASRPRTPARRRTSRACSPLWRSNLFGSSSKGHEYFLKHLLGVDHLGGAQRGVAARAAAEGGRAGATRRPRPSSTCWSRSTSA